jgi:hypothetical protein
MFNNIHTMTAQSPAFGVPAYGHSSVVRWAALADAQVSTCARISLIGEMGLTTDVTRKGDFPGTTAWRPPTC